MNSSSLFKFLRFPDLDIVLDEFLFDHYQKMV
jgi:hypothetical protein